MGLRLVVFGADSLVGSHFVEHRPDDWSILAVGRQDPRTKGIAVDDFRPLDISNREAVSELLGGNSDDVWVNFAARTDVDGCEPERRDPTVPSPPSEPAGSAWVVNGLFPGWAAAKASSSGRFFVQVSTDFVFDGTRGPYAEEDEPSGFTPRISWYGFTKGVGERQSGGYGSRVGVVRIAFPYRADFPGKSDLARTILERYRTGDLPNYYTDQTITPTWIPDVTETISALVRRREGGVFHVASPDVTSPFEFASTLLDEFGLDRARLTPGSFDAESTLTRRAPRPRYGGLEIHNVHKLGVHPRTFREGIQLLAAQTRERDRSPAAERPKTG
jgi:dTDP-4-dehydrorhamnose reductase